MTLRNRTAGPKDLIWSGSVQWESGPNSPVYAYVFGLDENVVDRVLQHIQQAVTEKEFSENYPFWVEWLGQSRITSPEEVRQGIEESIRIRNPSRHRLDELWIEGAHMPEVESAIEVDPLVIDFPTVSFEELSPYCQKADALRDFVIGVHNNPAPELVGASTVEDTMTRRRPSGPRRRTMRRRANSRSVRDEVRERLERRAEARAERRPPSRLPNRRLAELREERERRASLEGRREERRREARMAALEDRRRDRRREQRLAYLEERRAERRAEARRQRLAELRAERETTRQAAAPQPPRQAAPQAKTATPKKRIYVKANNSAGVPAGYYELDEKATRQLQAQMRQASAKKAPRRRKPRK